MRKMFGTRGGRSRGFSLVEVMVSTVLLTVGAVGVAQLIPLSVNLNSGSRNNTMNLVLAQRFMNEILDQPVTQTWCTASLTSPSCPDAVGVQWSLGDPTQPNAVVGSPIITSNGAPAIDFTQATIPNYSYTFTDPGDPLKATYDVRWAVVVTSVNAATPPVAVSKRILVGVRQQGGPSFVQPVTLDTMVSR